jgi:hypothetical protein
MRRGGRALFEERLVLFRQQHDSRGTANPLTNLGPVAVFQTRPGDTEALVIAELTAKFHVASILNELGVDTRAPALEDQDMERILPRLRTGLGNLWSGLFPPRVAPALTYPDWASSWLGVASAPAARSRNRPGR